MASKRRQLEEMIARTDDNIVRVQLTNLLNDELQRQNGIIRKVTETLDSLLREIIGLFGKLNPHKSDRNKTKICKTTKKQLTPNSHNKQKKADTPEHPDDLSEVIAIWPKLPEHVKAAISDIVQVS